MPDQETFVRLADEWQQNRPRGADVEQMAKHPAYQRIIKMGEPAAPWLLQRLAEKPDHWFVALNAITGASPVPSENRGRIKEMAQAWLNWVREHAYNVAPPVAPNVDQQTFAPLVKPLTIPPLCDTCHNR